MPELPEVENFKRNLQQSFAGQPVSGLTVHDEDLLKNCSKDELRKRIVGETLRAVDRRGKYLLFRFEAGVILNHLRMSGRWTVDKGNRTRLTLRFPRQALYMEDLRRLGTLHLITDKPEASDPLTDLGVEPMSDQFTPEQLETLCSSDQEIKRLLLDQHKIAGLGNIYSCESLFGAKIFPARSARSLSENEIRALYESIQNTLQVAIQHEGTSFDELYRTTDGAPGRFQHLLNVYDREGESCRRCDGSITRIKQGQRSTYYCNRCQN